MTEPIISCQGLRAGYGDVCVVRDLDLTVRQGEVVVLLGPNGAGKTTTLLTIAGLLPKLGGSVEVGGEPVNAERPHDMPRRGLAFVPDSRELSRRSRCATTCEWQPGRAARRSMTSSTSFPVCAAG